MTSPGDWPSVRGAPSDKSQSAEEAAEAALAASFRGRRSSATGATLDTGIYDTFDADHSESLEFDEVMQALQKSPEIDVWEVFGRTLINSS